MEEPGTYTVANSAEQAVPNPLLERVRIPGEIHRLPSQGLFYDDGELDPDVKDGEVHVHPMTAIDEITIRSPDLLFSGDAVEQVIRNCVPQVLKPKRLLAKDVDFLMAVIKKVSYGDQTEIQFEHDCENAKEHTYVISMDTFIKNSKMIDPTTVNSKYTVTLENGQVVKLNPIRYEQIIDLMQTTSMEISSEEQKNILLNTLLSMIHDVDGITDKKLIDQWLRTLPIKWVKQIDEVIDQSSDWGPDFTVQVQCKDCGETVTIASPMNPISFFI